MHVIRSKFRTCSGSEEDIVLSHNARKILCYKAEEQACSTGRSDMQTEALAAWLTWIEVKQRQHKDSMLGCGDAKGTLEAVQHDGVQSEDYSSMLQCNVHSTKESKLPELESYQVTDFFIIDLMVQDGVFLL